MSSSFGRALGVAGSVLSGLIAGFITNKITDKWSWTLATTLLVTAVIMVISQLWLSQLERRVDNVSASGTGAIAAGGSVTADIETRARGHRNRARSATTDGVSASGTGSVAAGRNVKGRIRIDSSDN
ncbi:hypothetical protein [Micromonospora inositola]|uniref:hypothetical protein n=1 Tax=Micromonospora inositola TaxID=47865 RepID=UPI0015606BB1|nr:hypothetical protein [Micromonospora inositola]